MIIAIVSLVCYLVPEQLHNYIEVAGNIKAHLNSNEIGYPFVLLFLGLIWLVIDEVLKIKNKILINLVISLIHFLIGVLVAFLMLNEKSLALISVELILNSLVFLVIYLIITRLNIFLSKLDTLSKATRYEKDYFLNQFQAKEFIKRKLKYDEISLGLMMVFSFTGFEKLLSSVGNYSSNYIIRKVLSRIVSLFKNKDVVFYMTKNHYYACFVFLKELDLSKLKLIYSGNNASIRSNKDPFLKISKILLKAPRQIRMEDYSELISLRSYSAIYGLHSCDLDSLEELCFDSMKNTVFSSKNNILNVYHPSKVVNHRENFEELRKFKDTFKNPNDFSIIIKKIIKKEFSARLVYEINVSYVSLMLFDLDSILNYAQERNVYEVCIRYIAMQALREFSRSKHLNLRKIIIPYSLDVLSNSNFSVVSFLKKLSSNNLKPNNLIMKINMKYKIKEEDYFFDNIKELQRQGLKLYFDNFNENNIELLSYLKPDYISLKPIEISDASHNKTLIATYYSKLINFLKDLNIDII